jgi:hypothetical protein
VRTQVSFLAAAALTAAVSGSSGAAAATSADQLCYGATVTTTVTGVRTVGPVCVPSPGPTDCVPLGTGLGTLFSVSAYGCIPAPEGTVSSSGE